MHETKINRTKLLQARLTPSELEKINQKLSRSTCRKLSDYVRKVLLDKPVTVKQRNQSLDDFMTEMITLRNQLNAIGNNYNQTVKKLHTLDHLPEFRTWVLLNESHQKKLFDKMSEIKEKINQINDQWLQ